MKIIMMILTLCLVYSTPIFAECPTAEEPYRNMMGTYRGLRTDFSGKEQMVLESENTVVHIDTTESELSKLFDPVSSIGGTVSIIYQPRCKEVSGKSIHYNVLGAGSLVRSPKELQADMDRQSSIPSGELLGLVSTNTLALYPCAGDTRGNEPSVVCSKYSPNQPSVVFQDSGRGFFGNLPIRWRIEDNDTLIIDVDSLGKTLKFQYLGELVTRVLGTYEYYLFQSRK